MRIRFSAPKRWRFLVGPCGEGFARSSEGALSSTGSAWVCCVVYTNSVRSQAHHAKKHIKITQRCDKSSCQILNVVFNRMDIDIDSDIDRYNANTSGITAPEVKKKQEILNFLFWSSVSTICYLMVPAPQVPGSSGILYSKPAALELPCLGLLRRRLPVPVEYSIVNLQRWNFHVLGSSAAGCWFQWNTL